MLAPHYRMEGRFIAKIDNDLSTKIELHVLSFLIFAEIRKNLLVIFMCPIIFKYTLCVIAVSSCGLPVCMPILLPYLTLSRYYSISNSDSHHGHFLVIACLFISTYSVGISYHAKAFLLLHHHSPPHLELARNHTGHLVVLLDSKSSKSWLGCFQKDDPEANQAPVLRLSMSCTFRPRANLVPPHLSRLIH